MNINIIILDISCLVLPKDTSDDTKRILIQFTIVRDLFARMRILFCGRSEDLGYPVFGVVECHPEAGFELFLGVVSSRGVKSRLIVHYQIVFVFVVVVVVGCDHCVSGKG